MLLDGTSRIKDKDGHMVRHGNFVSCFSTHSIVPEDGVVTMPKDFPLEHAKEFGATHFIDSSKEDPVPAIQLLTGGMKMDDGTIMSGGADYVFEAIGDPGAIVQAYWSTGIGGSFVQPGITPHDQTTNLPLMLLPLHQKSILGNRYGSISTHIDIPRLVNLANTGTLKLDKLITNKFKLDEINDVAKAMEKREIDGRWVCEIE